MEQKSVLVHNIGMYDQCLFNQLHSSDAPNHASQCGQRRASHSGHSISSVPKLPRSTVPQEPHSYSGSGGSTRGIVPSGSGGAGGTSPAASGTIQGETVVPWRGSGTAPPSMGGLPVGGRLSSGESLGGKTGSPKVP